MVRLAATAASRSRSPTANHSLYFVAFAPLPSTAAFLDSVERTMQRSHVSQSMAKLRSKIKTTDRAMVRRGHQRDEAIEARRRELEHCQHGATWTPNRATAKQTWTQRAECGLMAKLRSNCLLSSAKDLRRLTRCLTSLTRMGWDDQLCECAHRPDTIFTSVMWRIT